MKENNKSRESPHNDSTFEFTVEKLSIKVRLQWLSSLIKQFLSIPNELLTKLIKYKNKKS